MGGTGGSRTHSTAIENTFYHREAIGGTGGFPPNFFDFLARDILWGVASRASHSLPTFFSTFFLLPKIKMNNIIVIIIIIII